VLLDLVDGAIQGGDDLLCHLFSLARGDGVASNLVPEGISDLAQGAEVMLGMFLNCTFGANGFSAGLAVAVDFHANVLLAAGNPLDDGISGQGVFNGNLLVSSSGLASLVQLRAALAEIFVVIDAVRGGIFVFTEIALHHPVDITSGILLGLGERVDEGNALKRLDSTGRGRCEGSLALVATER